jgi:hypothetical protein
MSLTLRLKERQRVAVRAALSGVRAPPQSSPSPPPPPPPPPLTPRAKATF